MKTIKSLLKIKDQAQKRLSKALFQKSLSFLLGQSHLVSSSIWFSHQATK